MIICNNVIEIRHDDPVMIDRIENALRAHRLCDEFIPEPTFEAVIEWIEAELQPSRVCEDEHFPAPRMYQGSYSGTEAEFLKSWWRSTQWGTRQDVMADAKIERSDRDALTTEFCTAETAPSHVLSRMIELGCSIKGKMSDNMNNYAAIYDNGLVTEDPAAETRPKILKREYLEHCASRDEMPALDERGNPNSAAVTEYHQAQCYLLDCASTGDVPVLDERGDPDPKAVVAYYDAMAEEEGGDPFEAEFNTRLMLASAA